MRPADIIATVDAMIYIERERIAVGLLVEVPTAALLDEIEAITIAPTLIASSDYAG